MSDSARGDGASAADGPAPAEPVPYDPTPGPAGPAGPDEPGALEAAGEAGAATVADVPRVPDAVLALPLSGRRLLPVSLDLLMRAEGPLRAASFYVGFLLLATAGPFVALFASAWAILGDALLDPFVEAQPWTGWWFLTMIVAGPGYLVAAVESRLLAVAVIGAAIEGRPLPMGGLLSLARRRFWRVAAAAVLVGIPATIGQQTGDALARAAFGPSDEIALAGSVIGGVLLTVPFVYAVSGIVLGEVGALEAVRRSWRLFRARPRLALMVGAFGLVSQFVLIVAIGTGADLVVRVLEAVGFDGQASLPLVIGVSAALAFAFGTLVFLAEAIAATPAVHAFVALTHYLHGLEVARDPADAARGRRAWLTRPLLVGIAVAVGALTAGLASLSG